MRSFEAQYPGRCGECDGSIREGDLCMYVDDEIAHLFCPETLAVLADPCGECWLVPAANGACGCPE